MILQSTHNATENKDRNAPGRPSPGASAARIGDVLESLSLMDCYKATEKAHGFGALTARSRPDHAQACDCWRCCNLRLLYAAELKRRVEKLRGVNGIDFPKDFSLVPTDVLEAEYVELMAFETVHGIRRRGLWKRVEWSRERSVAQAG